MTLENFLDISTVIALASSEDISKAADNWVQADSLDEEIEASFGSRKIFCDFLGIGESTLTGWLKENRIPLMAKEAYLLLRVNKVLRDEIHKFKNGLKIIKSGDKYQICQFKEDEEGFLIGRVLVDGINDIRIARYFSSVYPALHILQDAKAFINHEIDVRGGDAPTGFLEKMRDDITQVTMQATRYKEWQEIFGKKSLQALPDFEFNTSTTKSNDDLPEASINKGKHIVRIKGQDFGAESIGELLAVALDKLSNEYPNCLQTLIDKQKRGVRPYIARSVEGVYPGRSDLATQHTPIEFRKGYFVGTNYGQADAERILRAASEAANIKYGKDLIPKFYARGVDITFDELMT